LSEQLADANRRLQSVQSEIVRSRMLTTVAEMAAGAAHEMNNPLAVISGRSQLLATTLSDPKQRAHAQLVFEKSQSLSNIITELMAFAKPQTPTIAPAAVVGLFDAAIELTKESADIADRLIEVNVADIPDAQVDARQLGAAMAEIITNAVQATDTQTGRISLTGSFDAFSQQLVLSISDNGLGMDEHVLRHAFDPFFSAKTAGRRQGMGLAKAMRWIEGSGGSMRIESQPNAGTRVIILLPAATQKSEATVPKLKQAT
jgi:signal transduction histidine kinase